MFRKTSSQPGSAKARIFIAEDHAIVRYGLVHLFNGEADLMVCGEAESVPEAIEKVKATRPDLLIVDINLNGSSGLELIRMVHDHLPKTLILVLTMHDEALYGELALRSGAHGYITKDEAMDKILPAAREVLSGKIVMHENLSAKLLRMSLGRDPEKESCADPAQRLAKRELEVFCLIGQWKSTRQIACELRLSTKTIECYRERIKEKLGLKSGKELVQQATLWVETHKKKSPPAL